MWRCWNGGLSDRRRSGGSRETQRRDNKPARAMRDHIVIAVDHTQFRKQHERCAPQLDTDKCTNGSALAIDVTGESCHGEIANAAEERVAATVRARGEYAQAAHRLCSALYHAAFDLC